MLNMDAMTGLGSVDGPLSPENYKRAVHRPPPSRFHVEMLPPTKQGSSFSFGMRICPITRGDRSSTSSSGSSASNSEYDIWRRWEDCLWFQDVLELEYSRSARQKKQRLIAGKGVKKNGFYKQDMASSWESLPPGPDPSSVAQDIHAYVPKLTKKGTLFRASQSTIDQRQKELTAFVTALFQDDAPALLKELRSNRIVTDFFGYWRRDYDLAKKEEKPRSGKERTSLTPSILSSYFSPSSPAFNESTSPQSSPSRSITRRRAYSATSSDSSPRSSNGSIVSSAPGIAEEIPVVFDHNPLVTDRSASVLEALPEDRELATKPRKSNRNVSIYLSPDDLDNRARLRESWQTTASASTYLEGLNMTLPEGVDRERSRMSIASIATFMTDSSADAIIPRPFVAEVNTRSGLCRSLSANSRRRRSSVAQSETYSDEEDGDVDSHIYDAFPVPSFHLPSPLVRRRALGNRSTTPLGRRGGDSGDENDSSSSSSASTSPASPEGPPTPNTPTFNLNVLPSSPTNSVLSGFQSMSTITPRSSRFTASPVPASPTASVTSVTYSTTTMGRRSIDVQTPVPSSPATTTFSLSTTESSPTKSGHITVKAAHNESIILLRISPEVSFAEVRHRIQDKFASQEKVSLTESFTLAIVFPVVRSPTPGSSRTRSNSLSSIGGQMKLILSQADWERAILMNDGTKMTLRVLDTLS